MQRMHMTTYLLCKSCYDRKFMDEEVYSNLAQAAKPYTGTMLQNIGQRVTQARREARKEVSHKCNTLKL
jgi:hypothetical protein